MATLSTLLGTFDFIIFFGALLAIMAVGLWVGRSEKSSKDYFLAGGDDEKDLGPYRLARNEINDKIKTLLKQKDITNL